MPDQTIYSRDFWQAVASGKATPVHAKYSRWLRTVRAAADILTAEGIPVTWWFLHLNDKHLINIPAPADGEPPLLEDVLNILPDLRSITEGEFSFSVVTVAANEPKAPRRGRRASINQINPQQQFAFMLRRRRD